MAHNNLDSKYFNWMCELIQDDMYTEGSSYRRLLTHLHDREFEYIVSMDSNRAEDGTDLRYRFAYECNYDPQDVDLYLDNRPCSVLEMLVALANRCEEDIMDDPDVGNRTGQWFWTMINNLGLGDMIDSEFDEQYTDIVIDRFLQRKYKPNGEGGLFTIKNTGRDLREVEIWYQLMWYLDNV